MLDLQHIKHKDILRSRWDQAILASEVPTVFAHSYFLDATSPGWDALMINDYETVFPLTWKRKFGILYLPQPYFTGQLGVFGKIDSAREQLCYNYISGKYKLIEIELNSANHLSSPFNLPKNTFVVDYTKEFTFNQNTKRNISKAHNAGMNVEQVRDEEIIPLSESILDPFLSEELKIPALELTNFKKPAKELHC